MFSTEQRLAVVLALVGGLVLLFSTIAPLRPSDRYLADAKLTMARLKCKILDEACEAYRCDPANKAHEIPTRLVDLLNPPWGGGSFLKNGEKDLRDPWGKPFEMERRKRDDGTEFTLVKTTAPDGTPISQFGTGPDSQIK